jgi:hypothetical protein
MTTTREQLNELGERIADYRDKNDEDFRLLWKYVRNLEEIEKRKLETYTKEVLEYKEEVRKLRDESMNMKIKIDNLELNK